MAGIKKEKTEKKLLHFFQISGRLRVELSCSGTMNALNFVLSYFRIHARGIDLAVISTHD